MEREHTKTIQRLAHAATLAHRRSGKKRPEYLSSDTYQAIARGVYRELIMIDEERAYGRSPLPLLSVSGTMEITDNDSKEQEGSESDGGVSPLRVDICNLD